MTVLIVLVINFVLFRILPGDPVRAVIGRNVRMSPQVQQALRVQFGLDKPVFPDQFLDTLGQWAQGNLGVSWSQRQPVKDILLAKLWNTLLLISLGQILSIILGVVLGLLAGWKRKTPIDVGALTFSLIAWATPTFWLGIILLGSWQHLAGAANGGYCKSRQCEQTVIYDNSGCRAPSHSSHANSDHFISGRIYAHYAFIHP